MLQLPFLALAALVPAAFGGAAEAASAGETFICHFGKYGQAIIDTRDPGASLTIGGRKYPIEDGSYFYHTPDDKIVIFFGPNQRFWDYRDVRDNHCRRRANKRSGKQD